MDLLILGGTVFLGRHIVDAAVARGHRVSLFNRGRSAPELFPDVEQLRGDRDGDLTALDGRRWDAVIDTCGYLPRLVDASAAKLRGPVGHYTFISTISVYADAFGKVDEESPTAELAGDTETVDGDTYGPLKARCEEIVRDRFGDDGALLVRPGLIVGPHDPTDRYTYWPWRMARGGDVLAPGDPDACVQVVDVRDLAVWIVDLVEQRHAGVLNAVGPAEPLTMAAMLAATAAGCGGDANLVWAPNEFLLEHEVRPWTDLPLWLPATDMAASSARARAAGLRFRPLTATARDTLAWLDTRADDHTWRAGMTPEREAELRRLLGERDAA